MDETERICPKCDARMRHFHHEGAQLDRCMSCGSLWFDLGELQTVLGRDPNVEETQDESSRRCPVCRIKTDRARIDDVPADHCHSCAGIFLEDHDFQALAGDALAPKPKKKLPPKACPGCESLMQLFWAEEVEIDKCFFCGGIFFDDGELEKILGRPLTLGSVPATGRSCSNCQADMVHGLLEEVEMDHCTECGGIYLDHEELDQLAKQRVKLVHETDREDPGFSADGVTYRCYGCGDRRPLHQGMVTGMGMCCDRCYPTISFGSVSPTMVPGPLMIGRAVRMVGRRSKYSAITEDSVLWPFFSLIALYKRGLRPKEKS